MPFAWNDYLKLAAQMNASQGDPLLEAKARTAISRAYYSTYHAAKLAYFRVKGLPLPRYVKHEILIDHYLHSSRQDLGTSLDQIKTERENSDYHCNCKISAALMKNIVHECDRLVNEFNSLKSL